MQQETLLNPLCDLRIRGHVLYQGPGQCQRSYTIPEILGKCVDKTKQHISHTSCIYIYVAHDILSFFEKNHLIQTSSEINGPNIFGVAVPLEVKNLIKMPKETSANHQRISTIHESHPFLWILVNV